MVPDKNSRGLYSLRYLSIVAVVTIGLGSVAWVMQNRQLALAAGVMGLYALHLLSIRYILDNQNEHSEALRSQWELLQRLVDPNEPIEGAAAPETGFTSQGVPETNGANDEASRSWPPLGLPLSTVDSQPELSIPAELEMPSLSVVPLTPSASENTAPPLSPAAEETAASPVESDPTMPEIRPLDGPHQAVEVPIPRHFALGTVALIRQLLTPAEVARILMEQRRQPDKRFATLAVELGLLEDSQREELLLAQQEGLFTEDEMRRAREGLRQFRESTARAISDLA
ncbi:MAG: hypothetical protein M8857_07995 [marine benthic group bacterium]|nr:hypothetical protein [Gemmatimonadota bacterium]MCL7979285.1 hypothetical protein [Gemmatimonadota bacterium]